MRRKAHGYQLDNGFLLYTGVRYIFSEIDLEITPLGSGVIEIEEKIKVADENQYDWLLGGEYQYKFTPRWSALINADFAIAGDNNKDYTANALLSYRISKLALTGARQRRYQCRDADNQS